MESEPSYEEIMASLDRLSAEVMRRARLGPFGEWRSKGQVELARIYQAEGYEAAEEYLSRSAKERGC